MENYAIHWIGIAPQILGLAAAGLGVYGARKEYAPERLGILGSILRAGRTLGQIVWSFARSLWPSSRGQTQIIHIKGIESQVHVSGSVVVELSYGPLSTDLSVEERLSILDQRAQALRTDLNSVAATLRDESARRAQDTEDISRDVASRGLELDRAIRNAMSNDLSLQAWGLV
jgi:hypothetical protein